MGAALRAYEARHPADGLLTLGDNDYTASPAAFARNWAASFGWAATEGIQVSGTLGNHDVEVDRGRYEFAALGMPARYYSRIVGDVQLFVLDSNRVDRAQTRWLRAELAASHAQWRIAVFHHPAWTCGRHRSNRAVRASWVSLLERFGVRLVLSGHDHNYQRFRSRGIEYVVDGGGGARLYPLSRCPASYPPRLAGRSTHGFLAVTATPTRLEVRALTAAGRKFDEVDVTREVRGGVGQV
jgi:3',5'-cyclic AMP phosphodiesterase CpdA